MPLVIKDFIAKSILPDIVSGDVKSMPLPVSLLKFIYEFTASSAIRNVGELMSRRLLEPDPSVGIPRAGVERIEALFHAVQSGEADPSALKLELDRWGLFERYQDRFFALFRQGRR